jgi:hypothetical protein
VERFLVTADDLAAPLVQRFESGQLHAAQGRGDVGEMSLVAQSPHPVLPGVDLVLLGAIPGVLADPEPAQFAELLGGVGIVGGDHAPFATGQVLDGVEREARQR